ncbi:hypothetical protein [Aestuariibaculum marinum]|uniref:hypothetical protein n=1 Tax=Aestuariibaculum marinum TaxID=2683592 RepID=UPI003743B857
MNRKDWELNWNAAIETGGVLVADEVKITAEVLFTKQVPLMIFMKWIEKNF